MKIYLRTVGTQNVFLADARFEEKDALKAAGFWWHPGRERCRREKCLPCSAGAGAQWWTFNLESAARLINFCTPEAKAAMVDHIASVAASRATDADIDIPCPEDLTYLPFQKAGVAYAVSHKDGCIISDEMGCISGDAVINVNRGGKGFSVSLEKAYKRFHGLDRKNYNWDSSIPTYARSLCDGELRLNLVKDILDKGVREVVKVTLQSGKELVLTHDHEVRSQDGWVPAEDLKAGCVVLTNGVQVCRQCGGTDNLITYKYAKFAGYCKQCMYASLRKNGRFKTGKFVDSDGYVRVTTAHGHHRETSNGYVLEHILVVEKHLGRLLGDGEQVHHRNGNRSDNRIENLEVVSCSEHHKRHNKHCNLGMFLPKEDIVFSVEPFGECHVYDIVMDDPHRNFVANGIVVHNCGKTIQALGLMNLQNIKTAIFVVPASLRLNWKREAEKWLVGNQQIKCILGPSDDILPEDDVVIVNYERLKGKILEALMSRDWQLLCCDEAHYLKNAKAKRTKTVLGSWDRKAKKPVPGLKDRCKTKLYLTGTPILNRPVELHPLLASINPSKFGHYKRFTARYCAGHQTRFGWDASGASNLDELLAQLRSTCMVRRLKVDVLKELPAKRRHVVELHPNGLSKLVQQETALYEGKDLDELRAKVELAEASGDWNGYCAAVKELESNIQIAFESMSTTRHELALEKVPAVLQHCDDVLEGTDKIVIFAHHRDVIEAIGAHYGEQAVTIFGGTSVEDRQKAVDTFQDVDSSIKVFIGGIKAAGVGLTLTAASTVIFAELDWVPGNIFQAEDRCHRIGQIDSVNVQHLVVDGSLDAKLAHTLVWKQAIIERALDTDSRQELTDELVKEVEEKVKAAIKNEKVKKHNFTEETIAACHHGVRILSGMCDGACERDGAGFNKFDATIGKSLAACETLTVGQVALLQKMLPKYHRQLGKDLVALIKGKKAA